MGITRTDLFTEKQNELANTLKVFAHPARIAIIEHMLKVNACINSDLVKELGMAQASISQHLKELKFAGIIQGTVEGSSMNYCINPDKWKEVSETLSGFFNKYFENNQCC
ncbi:metalloregulator ArsR/SmtB family transcription factor [Mangrovivirga sp. M17]|uniref:Metalloregulator ArsR/SmtB family transcription factor n=1 Tax=Mangrovivirga halotolerans TaxID=2993936 RepID=A0ABT3RRH5_9BACT|nr:metalloregulator ArsR/SmtB family transcription factor [Mangrovivirga halotolerans]MCX2744096.1 metalloregulator ArsR/SmtB family transcription factor [Mangrovivirga halotolerans]